MSADSARRSRPTAASRRRQQQNEAWMRERLETGLRQGFRGTSRRRGGMAGGLEDVRAGRLAASVAARRLLDLMD